MHIMITGAGGFVGRQLATRLMRDAALGGRPVGRISLIDRALPDFSSSPVVRLYEGDFADAHLLDTVFDRPVDVAFHLASMPGAKAEREPAQGYRVNLLGSLALVDRIAAEAKENSPKTRVVFASTVAVYGSLGAQPASEDSLPHPQLSYGAHKLMTEVALTDLDRRGLVEACSVRLPGIVARPKSESGHGSAFMSLLFHHMADGQPYVCPTSSSATAWWMSLDCCVDNLMHAATVAADRLPASRVVQLPVLRLRVGELVDALALRLGSDRRGLISYEPQAMIESLFGRLPALLAPKALAAGFHHDGSIDGLIDSVLGR